VRDREVISSAMGDVCPRCGGLDVRLSRKGASTEGATESTWIATCIECWHKWSPQDALGPRSRVEPGEGIDQSVGY
jgi:hypothetical protein